MTFIFNNKSLLGGLLLTLTWVTGTAQISASVGETALKVFLDSSRGKDISDDQISYPHKLTAAQAAADINILMDAMKEAQTGLYRYRSASTIDKTYKECLNQCKDSIDYTRMYGLLTALISITGCSHSGTTHAPGYEESHKKDATTFPFDIAVSDGKYYIRQNNSINNTVEIGSQLLSVNGISMQALKQKLGHFIDREGNNTTHLIRSITDDFPGMYGDFIGQPAKFRIKLIAPGSKRSYYISVPAQTREELEIIRAARYPVDRRAFLPLRYAYSDSTSTGVLTISSFNERRIQNSQQEFAAFIDSVFESVHKVNLKHLVIDLRGNRGGQTAFAKDLFSYFISAPETFIQSIQTKKTNGYFFDSLLTAPLPYSDTMQFSKSGNGLSKWMNNPNLTVIPHKNNRFSGSIYILIDGNTLSAGALFASLMQLHTDSVFIGEETGGAVGGLNGMPVFFMLPYSKIQINLSTAVYNFPTNSKDVTRGVIPNIPIHESAEDIILNRDAYMRAAYHVTQRL